MTNVVFLDRDGVINKFPGKGEYVTSLEEFELLPGTLDALKRLKLKGYKIFVISNQAGVAKKLYSPETLDDITREMEETLKSEDITLDGIFYCTHAKEEDCSCRKPRTGLLEKALRDSGIRRQDIRKLFFVGDSLRDIATGKNFGCTTILVLSGQTQKFIPGENDMNPDFVTENLSGAAQIIISDE